MPIPAGFFNKKRFKREEILSLTPSDLSLNSIYESMGITAETENARQIATNALFRVVKAQSRQFVKSRKTLRDFEQQTGLSSDALSRFGGTPYSRMLRQSSVDSTNWNQLVAMSAQYADFFSAKTATPEGIKSVNLSRDKYLFGTDTNGNPLRTMSPEESRLWGKVLDEFKKQYPKLYHGRGGSDPVVLYVAQLVIENPHSNLIELLNKTYYHFMDMQLGDAMSEDHIAQNREYLQSMGIDTTYMSDSDVETATRSIVYDGPKW